MTCVPATPLPRAKTWNPSNYGCNTVYSICMTEIKTGARASAENIISRINKSNLEITNKMLVRAISKAIMDTYDEAIVLDGETENEHFDRVYTELTAMEDAKTYFENL